MSGERYSGLAITFHWIHALIVLFLVVWGTWMVDLPMGAERGQAFALHKSVGILAFLLLLGRFGWRFYRKPPLLNPGGSRFLDMAPKIVHNLLYMMLFFVPIMGYASASFTKYDMKFFGIQLPKIGWEDATINTFFSNTHGVLAWLFVALIVFHFVGAVVHRNTFKRMSIFKVFDRKSDA